MVLAAEEPRHFGATILVSDSGYVTVWQRSRNETTWAEEPGQTCCHGTPAGLTGDSVSPPRVTLGEHSVGVSFELCHTSRSASQLGGTCFSMLAMLQAAIAF